MMGRNLPLFQPVSKDSGRTNRPHPGFEIWADCGRFPCQADVRRPSGIGKASFGAFLSPAGGRLFGLLSLDEKLDFSEFFPHVMQDIRWSPYGEDPHVSRRGGGSYRACAPLFSVSLDEGINISRKRLVERKPIVT